VTIKAFLPLFKAAYDGWQKDKAPRLGAALSYYSIFSMAPLLIISIAMAGLFFGKEAVQGKLLHQIRTLVGSSGAEAIQSMLASAHKPSSGIVATIVGIVALILGASGAFGELQDALNTIWGKEPDAKGGFWLAIRTRLTSFALVVSIGFLLLITLVISTVLGAMGEALQGIVPNTAYTFLLQGVNLVISFGVVMLLFAMIFKILPDVKIEWRDVWTGAAVTSFLFTIGKYLIGKYLGSAGITSAYGAAGSLVVILLWVYYSAQILFYGAEFTKAYAQRHGSHAGQVTPSPPPVEKKPLPSESSLQTNSPQF
jgi:membrane protein